MAIIKLSVTERRRVSVFFTCLVLAVSAWVGVTLSNQYSYSVKEILRYKNAPLKRAFHSLQADTVDVTVKGSGWQMLFSKINAKKNVINVDLSVLEYSDYIALNRQLKQINEENPIDNQIIAFNPDTLYFDFSNRSVRRVPIKLQSALSYQQQYGQSGRATVKPAYVTISGPSNRIDKIKVWYTDSVIVKNVNEPVNTSVSLKPSPEGNISIHPKTVQVYIPVDEFTEKTLDIPVKLVDNYTYFNVNIFPQKVKVTFTTSLGRYTEINDDMFEARASLELWRKYGYNTLPVKITSLPAYTRVVKIEPQNIDFIIKK